MQRCPEPGPARQVTVAAPARSTAVRRGAERLALPRATATRLPPPTLLRAKRWLPGVADDEALQQILQPSLSRLVEPRGPLSWPHPLRPFQIDGVRSLLAGERLLLADDMGLGKTVQVAAALRLLRYFGELESALVVAPTSLLAQWRRALDEWAPELTVIVVRAPAGERAALWRATADVHLVGYETLRGDVGDGRPALARTWGVVVLDEASRIKNPYASTTAACRRLRATRRWALTGTPLENHGGDVASLLRFLEPNERPLIGDERHLLRSRLARVQLRRRKEDVLPELPPKQVIDLPIELTGQQREAYRRAEEEGLLQLSTLGDAVTITTILELLLRLKQLCNIEPISGESAKLDDLVRRARQVSEAGHRALVFSQFTDARFGVARVARRLESLNPLCFTGQLSLSEREAVVRRFLTEPRYRALLLSLRAGGLGLNLQQASYVFHLDRWWNPAIEHQAEDRAHRLGQQTAVTVYRYLCLETVEERIDEILRRKRQLFQDIVEPVSLDPARVLSKAELLAALGLPPRQEAPSPATNRPAR